MNSTKSDIVNNKNDYTMLSFILLAFIFIFQYSSKAEEIKINMVLSNDQSKKSQINLTNYLFWKYLILYQLTHGIIYFLTNNINNLSLNYYYFFISILLSFSFILFFGKQIFNKNKCILVYGIILLFASLYSVLISFNLITVNNYFQVLKNVLEIFIHIFLMNNFEIEYNKLIDDTQIKNNLINNFIEKNELITIFMKITFQFIYSNLNNNNYFKQLKINTPSNFLSLLFSLLIILIYLYWNKKEENNNDKKKENDPLNNNYNNNYKIIFVISVTELFINVIYSLYKNNVIDFLKNKKQENNYYHLYNILVLSILSGITSFRILYSFYGANISSIAKINAMIFSVGIALVYFYKDFYKNLYGALLIEASFGLYSVLYKRIKLYELKDCLINKKAMIWLYLEIMKIGGEVITIKYNNIIKEPILFCLIISCVYFCITYFSFGNIIIKNDENNTGNIKDEKIIKKKKNK